MSRKIDQFKLGLFVVVCGFIIVAGIIWVGTQHYFEEKTIYATYFAESVKGLMKDATVTYRGVAIGRVGDVGLATDGRLVQVLLYLKPSFKVSENLSVRLREQGLTGLRFLEIDKASPNLAQLTPKIDFTPPYPLIPAQPSDLEEFKAAFEALLGKLTALDMEGLAGKWGKVADDISGLITGEDMRAIVKDARETSGGVNAFVTALNGAVNPKDLKETIAALSAATKVLADILGAFGGNDKQGVKDLRATIAAWRKFSESLVRRVESVPPDSLGGVVRRADSLLASADKTLTGLDRKVGETLFLTQQDLQALQGLLTELSGLIRTLREQPNRIIFPTRQADPFGKKP